MSYEYGRSPVQLQNVTCRQPKPVAGTVTDQFIDLARVIPGSNTITRRSSRREERDEEITIAHTVHKELCSRVATLRGLADLQHSHPFLMVTTADLAFCFYRSLCHLNGAGTSIPDITLQAIIDIGSNAVRAATQLAAKGRLFWNVIGSVFHCICVLLAMDTTQAAACLPEAFAALEELVRVADTRLTREALSAARHLLGLKKAKKRAELAQLEAISVSEGSDSVEPRPAVALAVEPSEFTISPNDNSSSWDVDWSPSLLQPYLWMWNPEDP